MRLKFSKWSLWAALSIALIFCGGWIVAQDIPDALTVVWIDGGKIYRKTGGNPPERWFEDVDDASRVVLAPGVSSTVAFTRADEAELWVVAADGTPHVVDVPSYIGRFAWLDEQTLAVKTLEEANEAFGRTPRDMLYFYDLVTDAVTVMGIAGDFTPGPSGVVVVKAGSYAQQDAKLLWVDAAGDQTVLLSYPAVSTASNIPFYPQVYWEAEQEAFRVAIPHPDAVYDASGASPVQLWRVTLNGEHTLMGEVPAGFFVQPQWSPDGVYLLFAQMDGSSGQTHLFTAESTGQNVTLYATGDIADQALPIWLDSKRFLYLHEGAYWLGQIGQESQRWRDLSPSGLLPPLLAGDGVLLREFAADGNLSLHYAVPGTDVIYEIVTSDALLPYVEIHQEPES